MTPTAVYGTSTAGRLSRNRGKSYAATAGAGASLRRATTRAFSPSLLSFARNNALDGSAGRQCDPRMAVCKRAISVESLTSPRIILEDFQILSIKWSTFLLILHVLPQSFSYSITNSILNLCLHSHTVKHPQLSLTILTLRLFLACSQQIF